MMLLPAMLNYIVDSNKLNNNEQEALAMLTSWDKRFSATSSGATIFNTWWLKFYGMVWNDEFGDNSNDLMLPSRDRTVKLLLKEPQSRWFDNINTPAKETLTKI
jgi:penicillin amidase